MKLLRRFFKASADKEACLREGRPVPLSETPRFFVRPGYPSSGCTSAEPNSVSPNIYQTNHNPPPTQNRPIAPPGAGHDGGPQKQ